MRAEILADGGSGPTLVYVPGIDGTGELLLGTAARLERRFRLVRLRYVGEPGDAGGGDSYAALAASALSALEERGATRPLLLAESFGGAVALQMALDAPESVAGVAIVNSFAHYSARKRLALTLALSRLSTRTLYRIGRRLMAQWALLAPRRDAAALEAFKGLSRIGIDAAYRRRLRMIEGLDLRPRLGEIRVPVALFAADRDRVVDSLESLRAIESSIPGATLEVIPLANHLVLPLAEEPWVERMEALARRAGLLG